MFVQWTNIYSRCHVLIPWTWEGLENEAADLYLRGAFKKLDRKGVVHCVPCSKEILYGFQKFAAISSHYVCETHNHSESKKEKLCTAW